MNDETIIGLVSGISALVLGMCGYLVKMHIKQSSCGSNGCCCALTCNDDEIEAVNTVKRIKTEKKRRESEMLKKEITASLSSNNSDVFINIENNIKELEETIKGEKTDSIV